MGRSKIFFDEERIYSLVALGYTAAELAPIIKLSVSTIQNHDPAKFRAARAKFNQAFYEQREALAKAQNLL